VFHGVGDVVDEAVLEHGGPVVVGGGIDAGPGEGGHTSDEGVSLLVEDHFGCLAAGLGHNDAVAALR